jgi:hypothetical protein
MASDTACANAKVEVEDHNSARRPTIDVFILILSHRRSDCVSLNGDIVGSIEADFPIFPGRIPDLA